VLLYKIVKIKYFYRHIICCEYISIKMFNTKHFDGYIKDIINLPMEDDEFGQF